LSAITSPLSRVTLINSSPASELPGRRIARPGSFRYPYLTVFRSSVNMLFEVLMTLEFAV
jgi:hypothetical protein